MSVKQFAVIWAAETMALSIRQSKSIKGIKVNGTEIKVSQLADDTTLFIRDKQSINNALTCVTHFGKVSGLHLNLKKCEGLKLGRLKKCSHSICGITWKNKVKTLGIYFGLDKNDIIDSNWKPKLDKFDSTLKLWSKRKLTLYGKVTILTTLALSKLLYNMSVLNTPDWVIKEANKYMYAFLWDGKRDRVRRTVTSNKLCSGGLNVPNIKAKAQAFELNWIKRIIFESDFDGKWKVLSKFYINKLGCNNLIFKCTFGRFSDIKQLSKQLPDFYQGLLSAWSSAGGSVCKIKLQHFDVRKQTIWYNYNIKHKGKMLMIDKYKHWVDSGIFYVNDFLKGQQYIYEKLTNCKNWMCEYLTVLKAIPQAWKAMLVQSEFKKTYVNTKMHLYTLCNMKGLVNVTLSEMSTTKDFYEHIMSNSVERCIFEAYWLEKCNITNHIKLWDSVWEFIRKLKDKKLSAFKYKLINKILPCKQFLVVWKPDEYDSPICDNCNQIEDYFHMLCKCNLIQPYLRLVEDCILRKFKTIVKLDNIRTLIFGYKSRYVTYNEINYAILIAYYIIFKNNCLQTLPSIHQFIYEASLRKIVF